MRCSASHGFTAAWLALIVLSLASVANAEPAVSATYVEGRLLAPCCWNQTLDVHESELATSLRAEVAARVAAGESAVAIEDDFVARYGERIRAIPRGAEPRVSVGLISLLVGLGALASMVLALRRWVRRAPAPSAERAEHSAPTTTGSAYDARLDEELRALDDK